MSCFQNLQHNFRKHTVIEIWRMLATTGKIVLLVLAALLGGYCNAANTSTGEQCVSREELEAVSQELETVKTRLSSQANSTGRLPQDNLVEGLDHKLDLIYSELRGDRSVGGGQPSACYSDSERHTTCSQVYTSLHPRSSSYYQLAPTGRPAYCDFDLTSAWQPAASCDHIFSLHPSTPSGYYWMQDQGDRPVEVFCDMGRRCCGQEGGWARVAHLDMTDPAQHCPRNFRQISAPTGSGRLCTRDERNVSGCSSMLFQTSGLQYSRVCGRVIAYQHDKPDAFAWYNYNSPFTLNDPYVDGVSITHGQPREHIWTFAGARDETIADGGRCPCSKTDQTYTATIPPYVGNDYFCDSGSRNASENRYYQDDPLWDGQGCGPTSSCCSFNNPPWFCKTLPQPASDDIELRLCATFIQPKYNEDTPIELVEIFVQ